MSAIPQCFGTEEQWGGKRKKEKHTCAKIHTNRQIDWSRFFSNKTSDALFIHMRLASTLCSFTHSWRLRGIESHPRQASGSYIGFFGIDRKKKKNLKLIKLWPSCCRGQGAFLEVPATMSSHHLDVSTDQRLRLALQIRHLIEECSPCSDLWG